MSRIKLRVCTAAVAACVAVPLVSFAVTLPTASRTPCYFGGLGGISTCMTERPAGVVRMAPKLTAPQTSVTQKPAPSANITQIVTTKTTNQTPVQSTAVSAVPLPLAGSLLLGSLGLMVLTNRKKKPSRRL